MRRLLSIALLLSLLALVGGCVESCVGGCGGDTEQRPEPQAPHQAAAATTEPAPSSEENSTLAHQSEEESPTATEAEDNSTGPEEAAPPEPPAPPCERARRCCAAYVAAQPAESCLRLDEACEAVTEGTAEGAGAEGAEGLDPARCLALIPAWRQAFDRLEGEPPADCVVATP